MEAFWVCMVHTLNKRSLRKAMFLVFNIRCSLKKKEITANAKICKDDNYAKKKVVKLGRIEIRFFAVLTEVTRAHFAQYLHLISCLCFNFFTSSLNSLSFFLLCVWVAFWPVLSKRSQRLASYSNSGVGALHSCCCPYLRTISADFLVRVSSRVVCQLCESKRTKKMVGGTCLTALN